jgi:hypothetical protein
MWCLLFVRQVQIFRRNQQIPSKSYAASHPGISIGYVPNKPITVAGHYKACTVFARSNAGIVGSNPA